MVLKNPDVIFARYLSGRITGLRTIDTSHCETDRRYTYIIDTDMGEHIAVKFSNNCFTTPERVEGWRQLISLYNELGIYAPGIIPDQEGRVCSVYMEGGDSFIAYAEEQKKYKTTDEFGIAPNDSTLYFEDMVKAAAKVALRSVRLPDWKSAWCLYDRFCADDETDETYYWQQEFYRLILEAAPRFRGQAERIWRRFLTVYDSFEPQYRALPQAFFQGDEGGLNVMLDENQKFAGVLDFNLAGAETVLNYLFRNFCRVPIAKSEIGRLHDKSFLFRKDQTLRMRLETVKRYYPFSSAEKAAFPAYYGLVYPLECNNCQVFQSVIRQGDASGISSVLDWIEYQQTRRDIVL